MDQQVNNTSARVAQLLEEFARRPDPPQFILGHLQNLENYLSVDLDNVAWRRPVDLVPTEELDTRMQLIREIDQKCRLSSEGNPQTQWIFSAQLFAMFLCIPLNSLRELHRAQKQVIWSLDVEEAIYLALHANQNRNNSQDSNISANGKQSSTPLDVKLKTSRNYGTPAAVEVRRGRDNNRCIFTKQLQTDVAHIIPFSVNSSNASLARLQLCSYSLCCFLEPSDSNKLIDVIMNRTKCSDRPWNIVTLSANLYQAWSSGKWGLVYLGTSPALDVDGNTNTVKDVTLQLRWLPPRNLVQPFTNPGRHIDVHQPDAEQELFRYILADANVYTGEHYGNAAMHTDSLRVVLSGTTVKIRLPAEDAEKMRLVVELQWACLRTAYLSGVVGPADLLQGYGDDDSEAERKTSD